MRRIAPALLVALLLAAFSSFPAHADPPPNVSYAALELYSPDGYATPGSTQTVSGGLRYTTLASKGVEPAGETIAITAQGLDSKTVQTYTAVTGEGGRFSVDVTVRERTSVVAAWGDYKSSSTIIPVKGLLPLLHFTKFSYSPSAMINARAEWGYQKTTWGTPERPFELQYSADSKKWKTIRRVEGETFVDFGPKPFYHPASGYWRWRYPGDGMYLETFSSVRKAWRWRTAMSKVKVAQKSVRVGKKVTVSGTLYRFAANKKKRFAYKNQKINIVFHCKGKDQWWRSANGRTDSRGRFKINAKTYCDGYFAAYFPGGKDTFDVRSPNEVYVDTLGAALIRSRSLQPARLQPHGRRSF